MSNFLKLKKVEKMNTETKTLILTTTTTSTTLCQRNIPQVVRNRLPFSLSRMALGAWNSAA